MDRDQAMPYLIMAATHRVWKELVSGLHSLGVAANVAERVVVTPGIAEVGQQMGCWLMCPMVCYRVIH